MLKKQVKMTEINDINNPVLRMIASSDSAGASASQIDTYAEFNKLGEYLNGQLKAETVYAELPKQEQNTLQTLYNNLKNKFNEWFQNNNNLPQINIDNAQEYAAIYRKLTNSKDSEMYRQKIENALFQFVCQYDEDAKELGPSMCDYDYMIRNIKKRLEINKANKEQGEKSLQILREPYDRTKLEASVQDFLESNEVSSPRRKRKIDLGNGKFDKPATQKTNVCWALAGINTLLTTEEGKELLESNCYYDKQSGVFAIHLQEAENNNLHDGIYIITPEDIIAESGELAEGEGDAVAYLIAVRRYFDEVRQNPELQNKMERENHSVRDVDSGNFGFRFFEIMTGGSFSYYNDIKKKFLDIDVQPGIGTGNPTAIEFEDISDIITNKRGAVVLGVGGHSISVVGMNAEGDKLIIQESNNSEDFSEVFSANKGSYILFNRIDDINGAPAYELSKEDFDNYIQAVSFIKW